MSEETEGNGGGPALDRRTQQAGERLHGILSEAGLLPPLDGGSALEPRDLGRMVLAFLSIENPRVRAECISLIEALSGGPAR